MILCGICSDNDEINNDNEDVGTEVLLGSPNLEFPMTIKLLKDPNVWVADSGASCDQTGSIEGAVNVRQASETDKITVANGSVSTTEKLIDIPNWVCDKNGNKLQRTRLKNVKYLTNAAYNLFSLTKKLCDGWKLRRYAESITITKGDHELKFDICIPTPEGAIYTVYLQRDESEVGATNVENQQEVTELKTHALLGCMGKEITRKTA